jgi:hypothetical protein
VDSSGFILIPTASRVPSAVSMVAILNALLELVIGYNINII